ncbi:hypothetical protein CDAR_442131 [Caerostris darwini]|uniref:Uncharacterized protein n=1 Tax=Caerostris darwini TaxID=1538125 RepID=A0AAV4V0H2_9ARAC|nr:hypothetical protein CDAR_442131 [Caerostris darwini]
MVLSPLLGVKITDVEECVTHWIMEKGIRVALPFENARHLEYFSRHVYGVTRRRTEPELAIKRSQAPRANGGIVWRALQPVRASPTQCPNLDNAANGRVLKCHYRVCLLLLK